MRSHEPQKSVIDQLAEFVKREGRLSRNQWLSDNLMEVYVRKSRRCFDMIRPKLITCLDIATIDVETPGKGTFSKWFLPAAIKLNPWDAVFVESVLSPRFQKFFLRNGFTRTPDSDDMAPCFYLFKGKECTGSRQCSSVEDTIVR
jgi:hypothetical protein